MEEKAVSYFIIEIQKTDAEHVAYLVNQAATRNEAESTYHMILAAAAISQVPAHGAILFTDESYPIMNHMYYHKKAEA